MNLTITLHCGGREPYACISEITTAYTEDWVTRVQSSGQAGGWTWRPIATQEGEKTEAYCQACTARLLDMAAAHFAGIEASAHNAVRDILLLVGIHLGLDVIAGWTDQQRAQAEDWASREHLSASDNPIHRVPKPEFLP
jgi:hypothetical protein